jgi:hypothetical protein
MPIPLAIPIAIAAASTVGGLIGGQKALQGNKTNKIIDDAVAGISGIKEPTQQDLTYALDKLVSQGEITPEEAKTYLMEKTAYSDISTDPRLRAAQMDALSSLQDISKEGGLTATDRAKLNEVKSQVGQEERGAREAIIQRAQSQGRGGSGLEQAALLESQQGAATREAASGDAIAAAAQQRALESLAQAGTLGGQIESQDFAEKSTVAQAKDALTKFNLENLQSEEEKNVQRRQAAQEANLAERQRIADTNVGLTNEQRKIKADANQTIFTNSLDKQKAITDLEKTKAQAASDAAKAKAGLWGNVIGAGGSVAGGLVSKLSDEDEKDISAEEPDLDAFMESLKPMIYKYKHPEAPGAAPGVEVGVMAQDVEKTPVGRTMVKETPGGKMLDGEKGFGVILAALAALNEKIDKMSGEGAGMMEA